jgi:hypothetical protein
MGRWGVPLLGRAAAFSRRSRRRSWLRCCFFRLSADWDAHYASFRGREWRRLHVIVLIAGLILTVSFIAHKVVERLYPLDLQSTKESPAEPRLSRLFSFKNIAIFGPSPHVGISKFSMQGIVYASLGEISRSTVFRLKAASAESFFRTNGHRSLRLLGIVYRCKPVGKRITGKSIIEEISEVCRTGVSNVLPFGNQEISDADVCQEKGDKRDFVQNDGRALRVVQIVFFFREGAIPEQKKSGCYSGIYGNHYERFYAPTKALSLIFVICALGGLVLSYKGLERADGKGTFIVIHGWLFLSSL